MELSIVTAEAQRRVHADSEHVPGEGESAFGARRLRGCAARAQARSSASRAGVQTGAGREPPAAVRTAPRCSTGVGFAAFVIALAAPGAVRADEGGVPFWFSGQYSSMSAVPPTPGWTVTLMPYYYRGSADTSTTFARGNTLVTDLDTRSSLLIGQASYAPATKVFGAQPMIGLGWGFGSNTTSARISSELASGVVQPETSDSVRGGTDLYPIAALYWNSGNHNAMTYLTGDIPVGAYNAKRLANIGIGHAAIDAGGGYTYLNQSTGVEASAVAGITYNWRNPDTDYRNGIDSHLDWAASQFLSKSWQVGIVGYVYYQLSNDTYPTDGAVGAARQRLLGGFRSRVASVGPEVGYLFRVGDKTAYLNVRGYWEFWARDRPEGYALFATLNLPF